MLFKQGQTTLLTLTSKKQHGIAENVRQCGMPSSCKLSFATRKTCHILQRHVIRGETTCLYLLISINGRAEAIHPGLDSCKRQHLEAQLAKTVQISCANWQQPAVGNQLHPACCHHDTSSLDMRSATCSSTGQHWHQQVSEID